MIFKETLKITAGYILLLLITNSVKSQNRIDSIYNFQPKTQFFFNSSVNIYNKLEIQNSGAKWLESKRAIGGSLGFGFSQNLFNSFSIIIGGNMTLIGHNFNYYFNSPVQHPEINDTEQDLNHYDYNSFTSLYLGFSYYFNNIINKVNYKPIVSIGIKHNRMLTYIISGGSSYYVNENEPSVRIFDSRITDPDDSSEPDFNFFSYYLKLGLLKQQEKFNTIQLNFIYHFTDEKIGKGTYKFSNLAQESSGNLELGANYLGIEFIYGFTFFKPKNK